MLVRTNTSVSSLPTQKQQAAPLAQRTASTGSAATTTPPALRQLVPTLPSRTTPLEAGPKPAAAAPAPAEAANTHQVMELVGNILSMISSLLQKIAGGSAASEGAAAEGDEGGEQNAFDGDSPEPSQVTSPATAAQQSPITSPEPAPAPSPPPPNPMQMMAMMGMVDPLAFDTSGKGIQTTGEKVKFDLDADGKKDTLTEVDGGMLALRGGKDGKDLLGNFTDLDGDGRSEKYADGFSALEALARREGLVNEKTGDTKLDAKDLGLLEKKYGLGMKQGYGGQKRSLGEMGITEINLSSGERKARKMDAEGNTLVNRDGATFKIKGQERSYADVWSVKG